MKKHSRLLVSVLVFMLTMTAVFSGCDFAGDEQPPEATTLDLDARGAVLLANIDSRPLEANDQYLMAIKQSDEYRIFEADLSLESKYVNWSTASVISSKDNSSMEWSKNKL